MRKVVVFGTFDGIHPGHEFFLKESASRGECLVAIVARDWFVKHFKGLTPQYEENQRLELVLASGLVQEAFLADKSIGTYRILEKIQPRLVCLGHDQRALKESLSSWIERTKTEISIEILPPHKREHYRTGRWRGTERSWS